eukprot:1180450-Rhodomonas_salina.1
MHTRVPGVCTRSTGAWVPGTWVCIGNPGTRVPGFPGYRRYPGTGNSNTGTRVPSKSGTRTPGGHSTDNLNFSKLYPGKSLRLTVG